MKVGITIPFYKNQSQLQKCKEAIEKQDFKDIEVYIHDNSEDNLGFTKACNIGLEKFYRDCDYTIVLNQDCYLKPDAVSKMVSFMESHGKCAIGGIKQISASNKNNIIHAGCTSAFPNGIHITGNCFNPELKKNKKMPWINGACMIVNNRHLVKIGLMDEQFFLICSDSDWCYTARLRGFEVWYIGDAECLHEENGISKTAKDKSLILKMKLDAMRFADKWIGDGNFREMSLEVFS